LSGDDHDIESVLDDREAIVVLKAEFICWCWWGIYQILEVCQENSLIYLLKKDEGGV